MRSRQPGDVMSLSLVHEQRQWITPRRSMGGKETAQQTECLLGGIGRNAAVAQWPWDWLILILIVVEAADQFECRRTGAGQQRLEKLDHRQKIDPVPMHCAHAGHEPRSFKSAGFQYIEGILLVTNDGLSSFINHQIIIAVEEPHLLDRNPHGLCRHVSETFGCHSLPTWLVGKIEGGLVHQASWLNAHPLPQSSRLRTRIRRT